MSSRSAEIVIQGKDQASAAIAKVDKSLAGLKTRLTGFAGGGLGGLLGGIGAAGLFGHMVSEFQEAELSGRKLEAVIRATGGAAGFSAKELSEFADELQKTTNFEGDATKAALAVLASFREIKGDTFKEATKAAMDMSVVMGQDLQSSIVQIGKALNSPLTGMTALQRVGVTFSAEQKEQIKNFLEMNDLASAQGVILRELANEFGGAAEATADPLKQMKNELGDIAEIIGETMVNGLREVVPLLREFAEGVKNFTAGPQQEDAQVLKMMSDTGDVAVKRAEFQNAVREFSAIQQMERNLRDSIAGMENKLAAGGLGGLDESNLRAQLELAKEALDRGFGDIKQGVQQHIGELTVELAQLKIGERLMAGPNALAGGISGGAGDAFNFLSKQIGGGLSAARGFLPDDKMVDAANRNDDAMRKRIFDETRTPQETFDRELRRISRLGLDQETFDRKKAQLQSDLDRATADPAAKEKFHQEKLGLAPLTEARFLTAAPGYASDPAALAKRQADDTKESKEVQKQQLVVLRAMERKLQRQTRLGVL